MLTFPRLFVALVTVVVRIVRALARSRADLVLENLVLRQQVATLARQRSRPHIDDVDRGFWVALREAGPGWLDRLVIVRPETVVRWHKERFRRYWTRLSLNFSKSANKKNDENTIVIEDIDLAARYEAEFAARWAQATVPTNVTPP